MHFAVAAALAVLAPLVAAQTADFDAILTPSSGQIVTVGTTFKITWTASPAQYNGQPFQLSLIGGETQKSQTPLYTIGTGPANDVGEFTWKIPTTEFGKPYYGIVISLLHDPSVFQYSTPFKLVSDGAPGPATTNNTASSAETTSHTETASTAKTASTADTASTAESVTGSHTTTVTGTHTSKADASTITATTTHTSPSTTSTSTSTTASTASSQSVISSSQATSKSSTTTKTWSIVTKIITPSPAGPSAFAVTDPVVQPTQTIPSAVSSTTSSAFGTISYEPTSAAGRVVGGPLALLGLVAGAALAL